MRIYNGIYKYNTYFSTFARVGNVMFVAVHHALYNQLKKNHSVQFIIISVLIVYKFIDYIRNIITIKYPLLSILHALSKKFNYLFLHSAYNSCLLFSARVT